ncbi:MAG: hypothetical protein E7774_05260 [Bradyrhizobium sp.]|nr:MAG: hypothetical protein E7774_05260 [Bradyrhizobium sp.]
MEGATKSPQFIYLSFGNSPSVRRELVYSVSTLLAEIDGERSRVTIFTDRPQDFADWGMPVVDIADRLTFMRRASDRDYRFRAKPATLIEALRLHRSACVMLDTDSFIRPGFGAAVEAALAAGAAMNSFVRADPYPFFGPFETDLPHLGRYRFDRAAPMLNSGLVAARYEHLPVLEDALVLLDRLRAAKLIRHDIEQFAVAEGFRLAGVKVALIEREFEHYCQHWTKRYMRRLLRRQGPSPDAPPNAARPSIDPSKSRVRLFKRMKQAQLALRALSRRLHWRGAAKR